MELEIEDFITFQVTVWLHCRVYGMRHGLNGVRTIAEEVSDEFCFAHTILRRVME